MLTLLSKRIIDKLQENTVINSLIIFYCSFMIMSPPFFIAYFPSHIKTPLRLLGILFILIVYFFYIIYKKRISKLFVLAFLMCSYFLVVCIFNHNGFYSSLYSNFLMVLSGIALFEIYINSELKDSFIKMNYLYWLSVILLSIIGYLFQYEKIITMVFGYWNYSFIYNRNIYLPFFIVYILFEKQYIFINKSKVYRIISYIMSILLVFFSILTGAAISTATLIIIYSYEYIFSKIVLYKRLFGNFRIYFIILLFIFFLLVFPGSNSPITNIISEIFHKEPGLSGRDAVYDIDRMFFLNNPIFGYGARDEYYSLIGVPSAHSFVFQYLIDGGIIGLLLISINYKKIIDAIRRKIPFDLSCYLLLVLFAFTMRNLFEAIGLNYMFFPLASIYFSFNSHYEDYYLFN